MGEGPQPALTEAVQCKHTRHTLCKVDPQASTAAIPFEANRSNWATNSGALAFRMHRARRADVAQILSLGCGRPNSLEEAEVLEVMETFPYGQLLARSVVDLADGFLVSLRMKLQHLIDRVRIQEALFIAVD